MNHDGKPSSPLVQVQPGAGKRPFFFLHGDLGGGGFYCVPLARRLGPEQPFYSIHPHGVFGDDIPLSIEVMASELGNAIRFVQPEGPYLLGGYCNGALVAYEMARQFAAKGQKIDLLLLAEPPLFTRLIELWQWADEKGLPNGLTKSQLQSVRLGMQNTEPEYRYSNLHFAYRIAFAGYRLRPYPGRITLVHPADAVQQGVNPFRGWDGLVESREVHLFPGTFHTTITTHFSWFAETVQACLRKAQGRQPVGG